MTDISPYTIRQLAPTDIAAFRDLMAVFGDAFADPDTYTGAPPGTAYLESLLAGDTFIALAALAGDTVVGGLAAYQLSKFERERSEIYIYDLAVAAAHRRRGLATALVDRLKPIAAACGAEVIIIQADIDDPPAIALYSKLGTREHVLHFDIEVG